jgi:hypothetical protein
MRARSSHFRCSSSATAPAGCTASSTRAQSLFRFAVGDPVPVAYSQADPQQARIDTLWLSHGRLLVALVTAVLLVGWPFLRRRSAPV